MVKQLLNQRDIHLAHQAAVVVVHPIHNAHGAGGDEVAGYHFDRGTRHGRIGQRLAEGGFNLVAQLACGFQHAVKRHGVGNAHALVVARLLAFQRQLFVHLRAKAIYQNDLEAHAVNQRQVLHDVGQFARCNGFARHAHHQCLAAVHMDVGRNGSEPRNESEIENGRHGDGLK